MRNVLTIVAVVLVAVLSVALVGPLLLDWPAHRSQIEAELGAMSGTDVVLTGPITARLLPTPYLELGEGSLSAHGPGAPKLSFASARLELALVKLASGAIRFADIRLEKPVLTIVRGADGALNLPAPREQAQSIGFDRLLVEDGRLRIVGDANGSGIEVAGLQVDASWPSLEGPGQISGRFSGPNGAPIVFRLASERAGSGGTPLRASVDPGPGWPEVEFDGALENSRAAGSKGLRLIGSATLSSAAPGEDGPLPWRVVGAITADLDRTTMRGAEFTLGPDERAIRADGEATLAYGSLARLSIALKSKQANVDSLLRHKDEDGVAPRRALAFFSRAVAALLQGSTGRMAIDADVSAESIILGAQTISDASGTVRATPGEPLHTRFELGLPARSRLHGEGQLETGAAPRFLGDIDFSSADFEALRDWASLGAPDPTAKIAALGDALAFRSVSLSGAVEASTVGFSGRNLKIALDRSSLTGALAFASPLAANPGRLDMDLASDSLDIDTLPSFGVSARAMSDLDLSLALKAGAVHISRVGEAEIDAGSMSLKLTKSGPDVTLDHLSLTGLDGASVDVQGVMGRDSISANGRLRADRVHDFAVLLSRLAPSDWSRVLVERAAALSPASLTFEAHGDASPSADPALVSLKANGSAGATQFSMTADPQAKNGGRAIALTLDSPDSGALLRQLGLEGATTGNGRAHIAINASGGREQGYDFDAASAIAGSDLTWRGRYLPAAKDDDARLFGAGRIRAQSLAPLLSELGSAPPGLGALGSVDVTFDATLRGDRWTFSRIAATVGRVKASGSLSFQPTGALDAVAHAKAEMSNAEDALAGGTMPAAQKETQAAELQGELSVDRLALGNLLALALGPPASAKAGSRWSDAKFAPPPLTLPATAIRLKVGALELTDALPAQAFAATLHFDRRRLDLDDIVMQVSGGAVSGRASLRRDGETATLSGKLALDSARVDRPGFSGRIGGTLDFASTGRSPAALIEGLAGAGSVNISGAALARSDPDALDRVVATAQNPDAALDETNIAFAFGNELGKAPLPLPDGTAAVSLSAGVMKFGPIAIARPHGDGSLIAYLDLPKLALETRLVVTSSAADLKFWSGPPPTATIDVQNALEAPKRQLDVGSLSAGLAAQAIARETERIAALEADIRERAYFNRRLKGERFMDRREQEIEDWRVEQARLKGLSERLQQQEEAEKAAELEAAQKRAAQAAADKAAAEKAAADNAETAKDGAATIDPSLQNELGANAPTAATPTPPVRPKPRPIAPDPTARGLY